MNLLSSAYGQVVAMRNRLYDRGIFTPQALSGPVISIGNISVGGSGKTPFVLYLGELLKQRDIAFDVLSRGYGRKTRGVLQVARDGSAHDFGDEPVLISRRLGCPVVVGASRYEAGRFAEQRFGSQLHLLDDGFQHRQLARDFDIVLVTPEDSSDRLLPAGRLREPIACLERADVIVLIGNIAAEHLPLAGKTVWRAERSLFLSGAPKRALVFSGIARPEQFVRQLQNASIEVVAHRFYPDHHAYSDKDVQELIAWRERQGGAEFITTEKDAVNLGPRLAALGKVTIARVTMSLESSADRLDSMLRVLRERHPAHEKILLSGPP